MKIGSNGICRICSNPFVATHSKQKTCSKECSLVNWTQYSRSKRKEYYKKEKPEVRRSKFSTYYRTLKGKVTVLKHNLKTLGNILTREQVFDLIEKYSICFYCGQPLDFKEISIDHKQPISRGGSNDISNLHFIHIRCNELKGALTHDEYSSLVHYLKFIPPEGRKMIEKRLLLSGFIYGRKWRKK